MQSESKAIGWPLVVMAAGIVLALAAPAHAVDGVIEINQARAIAGGVSTGDEPGFPVTVTQPGSYRLTGNLTVPDANTTAIHITTTNVTVDLNGFAIMGPGSVGSGGGIDARSTNKTTVLNGAVDGMGDRALFLGANARVEKVRATNNSQGGIVVGDGSSVSASTANDNGSVGISAGSGSVLSRNVANGNREIAGVGGNGILISDGAVSGNTANNNVGQGIVMFSGGTVVGNSAQTNGGRGLSLGANTGYAKNVLSENNGGNSNAQVFRGIQMGQNVCGTALCP